MSIILIVPAKNIKVKALFGVILSFYKGIASRQALDIKDLVIICVLSIIGVRSI
jgi:hypothetical protein